ncbi:hypothetical protein FALBO_11370 [Fusarium albosuccineum]|uniref:Uncharacterized protein n=1 Tax=Fusarium albosuccineum TaxID=1237068 RepID=A0A8H4L3Y2_9HYPO|nr:hypothetical protein FALBO_11370 [Fusarium albosuccineum]
MQAYAIMKQCFQLCWRSISANTNAKSQQHRVALPAPLMANKTTYMTSLFRSYTSPKNGPPTETVWSQEDFEESLKRRMEMVRRIEREWTAADQEAFLDRFPMLKGPAAPSTPEQAMAALDKIYEEEEQMHKEDEAARKAKES